MSVQRYSLVVEVARGTILIGGHAASGSGVDSVHARDEEGYPVIPSTALRGGLRETAEALLRGAGLPACDAGSGREPGATGLPTPCALDGGRPCQTCRLFGTQTAALSLERNFAALRMGDARLEHRVSEPERIWELRTGVSIARRTRTYAEKHLFTWKAPATARHRYVAEIGLADESLETLLQAAVSATVHLGAARSRGFGRVDMALERRDASAVGDVRELSGEAVRIRVTLRSAAALSVPASTDGFRDTRREIPGAAMRGALGFALAESLADPDHHSEFQRLVAADGARFGFLYPVDGDDDGAAGPWPITARTCKAHPIQHGVIDTLLDRLLLALCTSAGQANEISAATPKSCPACGEPLRPPPGGRRNLTAPATRTMTRVSIDRMKSSARDGALFTNVLLEAGTRCEGTIRCIPPDCAHTLLRGLALSLSVGRGRTHGWGEIGVEVVAGLGRSTILDRRGKFLTAVQARLSRANMDEGLAHRLIPITLISPLIPVDGDLDGSATLESLLGMPLTWALRCRRFCTEGSWDQRTGEMHVAQAVAAGSVYVACLESGCDLEDLERRLMEIERTGAGLRAHQGYGEVLTFDQTTTQ